MSSAQYESIVENELPKTVQNDIYFDSLHFKNKFWGVY